jgi:hypothetical protein
MAAPPREYQDIYARFAGMIARGESEMDLSPLTLVSDAFLVGKRFEAPPFQW